jgi:hypothetical protein
VEEECNKFNYVREWYTILKKIFFGVIIIVGVSYLITILGKSYFELQGLYQRGELEFAPSLKVSLVGVAIGVLFEFNGLWKVINGSIKINWFIVPGIILLIIAFLPSYYTIQFPIIETWDIQFLSYTEIHVAIDILAGILLVRSFAKN